MLLIHPVRLSLAIGTPCLTGDGSGVEGMLEQLRLLTPRVAAALDHSELDHGTFRDTFMAAESTNLTVRLGNGHLTAGAVTLSGFYDTQGSEIVSPIRVDREYGFVYLGDARASDWATVTYQSGFAVPDDTGPTDDVHPDPLYRVGAGVPDWLQGIISDVFVSHQRNNKVQPAAPKEYGFLPTINEGLLRSLKSRIYGRYMRQRSIATWPIIHERVVP